MAILIACCPVSWPSAWPASSTTAPSRSETTAAASRVDTEPWRRRSTYMSISITPCECRPARSASTRPSATVAAAVRDTPAATNRSATNGPSRSAGTTQVPSMVMLRSLPRGRARSSHRPPRPRAARVGRERRRDLVERTGDVGAVEIERLVDVAAERRTHELPVLANVVAQRSVRHDRQRNVAVGLLEQPRPNGEKRRRAACRDQRGVEGGVLAAPRFANHLGLARLDFGLARQTMERAEQIRLPRDAAFLERPAERDGLNLDAGAHEVEQVVLRHLGDAKTLVLLELDQALRFEAHQGLADRTRSHAIALAQRLDPQPLVRHQPARDDVRAHLRQRRRVERRRLVGGRSSGRRGRQGSLRHGRAPGERASVEYPR